MEIIFSSSVGKKDATDRQNSFFKNNQLNFVLNKPKMRITDRNFSPTGISETDFRDKKFDELVVWYIPFMFEILKQIELLICKLENFQRV